MKHQIFSIITIFGIFFFTSCAPSEVDIYFPSEYVKVNKVIINGEHNLAEHVGENPYSSITIGKGKFTVDVNGTSKNVTTRKGGLLNLNEEEFVVFPIFYTNDASMKNSGSNMVIVVDSVAYLNKNSVFMKLPEDQRKNAALKQGFKPYNPEKAEIWNTGVIQKTDFFAEKGWELNIHDEIPDEMTVRSSSNSKKASAVKTILLPGSLFKIQAMLSDDYWTLDLRE